MFLLLLSVFETFVAQEIDKNSKEYEQIESLFNVGQLYYRSSNFDLALEKLEKASLLYSENYNQDSKILAEINIVLGLLYANNLKTQESISLLERSLIFFENNEKKNYLTINMILGFLGGLYTTNGNYQKAYNTLYKTLSKIDIKDLESKKIYLSTINQLINACSRLKNKELTVTYKKESIEISEQIYGLNSEKYIENLEEIGGILYAANNLKESEKLYEEALKIRKETYGELDTNNVSALLYLGAIKEQLNDNDLALKLYKKALSIQVKEYGKKHSKYAITLGILAELNAKTKNYEASITLFEESIKIYKYNLIENEDYFFILSSYASLLLKIGDFDKALKVHKNSLKEIKNKFGDLNFSEISILNSIGDIYLVKKEFDKAIEAYSESFNIAKKNIGYFEDKIFDQLINLSSIYSLKGNYDKALEYSDLAKEKVSFFNNTFFQNKYLFNLGTIYLNQKKFKKAEEIFLKLKNNTGFIENNYLIVNQRLCVTYLGLKDYKNTFNLSKEISEYIISEIEVNFNFMSEEEKKKFIDNTIQPNIDVLSLILNSKEFPSKKVKKSTSLLLNNILLMKGILLNSSKDVLTNLSSLKDPEIDSKIIIYRNKKNLITAKLQQPKEDISIKIVKEQDSLKKLEKEIIKLYSKFFDKQIRFNKNYKETLLNRGELAIEFSNYKVFDKEHKETTVFYTAYLYKKHWKTPKVVNLFEEKQLKKYLSISGNPNELYKSRGTVTKSNKAQLAVADSIYNLVWKPLEKYLDTINNVYFSPDGLLHKIPFAALPNENNQLIGELYNIQQMGNTADVNTNTKQPNLNDILLIGGVKYDYQIDSTKQKKEFAYSVLESATLLGNEKNRNISRNGFDYLEGTEKEIKDINNLLSNSKQLSGYSATETAFKKLSGNSPSILHIATHGFFFKKPEEKQKNIKLLEQQNSYQYNENPLLRSGLLFANANYAWQNGNNPYEEDDGILTALEISNLDLKNTDIVILSACETGLGDIEGSEGVYGLQRAFKMAGVKTIIMSLWPVPDAETAEFMNLFYTKWKSYNNSKKAFKETQQQMMIKYREEPQKWAAFVYFE
jgi:CHAT domain-containing protein/tetratricopeptide (TPR) repeat protein